MKILSLGSNIGDKEQNLKLALEKLSQNGVEIIKVSSIYLTEPIGYQDQADFYNIAVMIETNHNPLELLQIIHKIEAELKRVRKFKDGPRTIDIDIIAYDDYLSNTEKLTIPHKEYQNRKFVLYPLREIAENFRDPKDKRKLDSIIENCPDSTGIVKEKELTSF